MIRPGGSGLLSIEYLAIPFRPRSGACGASQATVTGYIRAVGWLAICHDFVRVAGAGPRLACAGVPPPHHPPWSAGPGAAPPGPARPDPLAQQAAWRVR